MKARNLTAEQARAVHSITELPEWQALDRHRVTLERRHLRELFAEDDQRGYRFHEEAAGIYLDYSKQRITEETVRLLETLARARGVPERIEAMFAGDVVNASEKRPALHVALRAPEGGSIYVNGHDVVPEVHAMLERMSRFCNRVRSGAWQGYTGYPIRNVVNIGIGGSGIGPEMAAEALRDFRRQDMTFRFVSNLDGADFTEATRDLDPAETLFVICSNSFTTIETLSNAHAARNWCVQKLGNEDAVRNHFVAVSSRMDRVSAFGIDRENSFGLWEWVGGRYSIDSAVGLSTMLAIGPENFYSFLAGFRSMDEHFHGAPLTKNLPALMGMLGVWNTNFLGTEAVAVLPYADSLKHFPDYVQELNMESNGKRVTENGELLDYATAPVYWGMPGTDAQHSFMQLVHQGTRVTACDFIGFCSAMSPLKRHHDMLIAHLLAQGEILAFGYRPGESGPAGATSRLAAHQCLPGNRPSTTIMADRLEPKSLGALIALYEHSVFVQGVIWNIDPFDQWGVEAGKIAANRTARDLASEHEPALDHDSSTNILIQRYRRMRGEVL